MLEIVAWNTRGARWEGLLQQEIVPIITNRAGNLNNDHLLAVTTECGWPFWVPDRELPVNTPTFEHGRYNWQQAAPNGLVQAFQQVRNHSRNVSIACVPWVRNPIAVEQGRTRNNSRCSNGMVWVPSANAQIPLSLNLSVINNVLNNVNFARHFRPFLRLTMSVNNTIRFVVFSTHMVSGAPAFSTSQLVNFMSGIQSLIPVGVAGMIVGDLNINLLNPNDLIRLTAVLPAGWRIVRTFLPTHQGGSELDFGLIYDPRNIFNARAQIGSMWGPVNNGGNGSDHAVVHYFIS